MRARLLHLLPRFKPGAPLAFICDLRHTLQQYHHLVLTNTPIAQASDYQDQYLAKRGLDVRYTQAPVITRNDLEACRANVIIMYDVGAADLESPRVCADVSATIYYAHYAHDASVFRIATLETTRGLAPGADFFPPYVHLGTIKDLFKRSQPAEDRPFVAMLAGDPKTFDFELAAASLLRLSPEFIFIVPGFQNVSKEFDRAIEEARKTRSVFICPHVVTAVINAYRRLQFLVSMNCFRIDTEVGSLQRPVIQKPKSAEQLSAILKQLIGDRRFLEEAVDRSRTVAVSRDLNLHLYKFNNLVRRLL